MISGFTFIRNGEKLEFPYIESIRSMLPLVDELVVLVGKSEDSTLNTLKNLKEPKLRIFESIWPIDDTEKMKSGVILSQQTNLALSHCVNDWCIYLQADEVLHEDDLGNIKKAIDSSDDDVDGLLFDYLHFYGSFDIVQCSRSAYRREVRAIRKSSGAQSVGDAQSFRKKDGSKLRVIRSHARIFHYGWVRSPEKMKEKTIFFDTLFHGQSEEEPKTGDNYRYKKIWGLKRFRSTHPNVMKLRIQKKNWNWDIENAPLVFKITDLKKVLLDLFERFTGIRLFEYRSYRLINNG